MSFDINQDFHNNATSYMQNFRASVRNTPELISKPIAKVENAISSTVDSFIQEPKDDEKKKSHKTAITAGSTALVLTAFIALLNPSFSGKFISKLRIMATNANAKAQKNKNNFIASKFYKFCEKNLKIVSDLFQFTNTINALKDVGFKWLCTANKFDGVKNNTVRDVLKKCDAGLRTATSGIHNSITKFFDSISKKTVYRKYAKVNNDLNSFEQTLYLHRNKLTPAEQKIFDAKFKEIGELKEYFSKNKTAERLLQQEKSMQNLEKDFTNKFINEYCKKFKNPFNKEGLNNNISSIKNNMSYWAEDMLMPSRNQFEQQGKDVVQKLVGDGNATKGKYQEVIDLIKPHLKQEENLILNNRLNHASKKLFKANRSECIEYFDKKRDLVLGGAPTDILTGLTLVGMSGVAIGKADSKEDKISRSLTLGFPAIAGVGTSLAMTAMLFSGVQGMIIGSLAS